MRENIKSVGLILAIAIASISLPTSIVSMMGKPSNTTEINNYYYNNTVIETYNNTIIETYNNTIIQTYNNTIIERYNNTIIVIVNNTIIINETIEEPTPIPEPEPFVNRTRDWLDYDWFTLIYNPSTDLYPYEIIDTYELGIHEWYFYEIKKEFSGASPKIVIIEDKYLDSFIKLYQLGLGINILPSTKLTFPNSPYNVWYSGYWRPSSLANRTVLVLYDATSQENTPIDYRDYIWSIDLMI